MGSSHQSEKVWPRSGKRRESVLKTTSVLQSWARACTWVVFTFAQPIQMNPFTPTVAANAPIAMGGSVAASLGLPGNNFVTDSCKIWRNETIIIIEKTRMLRGSRRRRPTGNLCWRRRIFQATSLLVVHIIKVQSKSRAESTREAIRDREEEKKAAHILAMRRRTLATTLICRGCQSLYNVSSCKN